MVQRRPRSPSTRRITIRDVAKMAGVSISTVSRVISSREDQPRNETQKKVMAAIRELHFVPNRLAAGLKGSKSQTLGVVVPNILNPFFTGVVRSIQDYITSSGYEILICNTDDSSEREKQSVRGLLARRVDGLIVAKCVEDPSAYEELAAERYPLVLIDRQIPGLGCDVVVVDNFGICQSVINRLLKLGHERIGILTPPLDGIEPRIDRVKGCRKALRACGRDLPPGLLVEVDFHRDSGAETTARLLSLPSPPTALFVLNTFLAVGSLREIEERKLRLPGDLSFVMFDDPEWSELLRPQISAVRQPIYEIGSAAGRLVMERIKRPEKAFENIRLEARLIERESVGECKA